MIPYMHYYELVFFFFEIMQDNAKNNILPPTRMKHCPQCFEKKEKKIDRKNKIKHYLGTQLVNKTN